MNSFIEALPFPKKGTTWFAVIISLVMVYVFYYLAAYPYLKDLYNDQLLNKMFHYPESENSKFDITVRIPRYISDVEAQWAYFEFYVPEDEESVDFIKMFLSFDSTENAYTNELLLESYTDEYMIDNSVELTSILPGMRVFARLPFLIDKSTSDDQKMYLNIYSDQMESIKRFEIQYPETNLWKAFLYSFLNQILLPPWSNGVIILGIIFVFYFVEESKIWENTRFEKVVLPKFFTNYTRRDYLCPIGRNGNFLFQNPIKNRTMIVFIIHLSTIFVSGMSIFILLFSLITLLFDIWKNVHPIFIAVEIVNVFVFLLIFFMNINKSNYENTSVIQRGEEVVFDGEIKARNNRWDITTVEKNFVLSYKQKDENN